MASVKRESISGWGNALRVMCNLYRPEKERELAKLVVTHQGALLARGMGRSYGDAAIQPEGLIRTERLDHLIEFDAATGVLRAQAGVSLADVMDFSIPRGYLPPVIPGTKHVSLGGAFACNVHGKNHFREGEFAEHVRSIRLLMADGKRIECSPKEHADIFWATAGGMGMTGIIEELTIKLKPIHSASLRASCFRVHHLGEMFAAFEQHKHENEYMVGWLDHMAKGELLGRGVFEVANHIPASEGGLPFAQYRSRKPKCHIPFHAPSLLLNRFTMALYNRMRFKRVGDHKNSEIIGFDNFFHPLDGIGHWNKLYGKRGFFQYQCLIPDSPDCQTYIHQFLTSLHEAGLFSFLAVIKYHREGKGPLTFSKAGYSIALDFPNTARVRALLPQLDSWIAKHNGRIYLAKDALLTPKMFDAMYGKNAAPWRELIHDLDPESRFTSLMSQRLQWKK